MSLMNYEIVKNFSNEEKKLLDQTYAGENALSKQANAIISIHVARMQRESTQMLIEANRDMSKASERNAKSLTGATWALVFVTLVLVVVTLLQHS
jgi:hypothetical protein